MCSQSDLSMYVTVGSVGHHFKTSMKSSRCLLWPIRIFNRKQFAGNCVFSEVRLLFIFSLLFDFAQETWNSLSFFQLFYSQFLLHHKNYLKVIIFSSFGLKLSQSFDLMNKFNNCTMFLFFFLSHSIDKICAEPKDVGICKAEFPRFYYNPETSQCEKFYYGGCEGNKNNFVTKEECEDACVEKTS